MAESGHRLSALCSGRYPPHPPPPVIFMTAYDEPAARAQSEKAGAVAYLTKPLVGKRLIETIDRVIRSMRVKKEKT